MGRVISLISITPDGFVDAGNVIIDAEFFDFTRSLMSMAETVAFGRNTFEEFQARWPGRLEDEKSPAWVKKMASSLHHIPKIVFSSTLKETAWHNSTIVKKLDLEYITHLKQSSHGALLTFGSLTVIEALTEMNMVDDYYFNIQPLIPGKGDARFFSKMKLSATRSLRYISSRPMSSGSTIIHYKCAAAA
jgi:dihydrofolate reductase